MADDTEKRDKTEDATPRRRQEAREKGQVALSTEMIAAVMLGAMGVTAFFAGSALLEAAGALFRTSAIQLGSLGVQELAVADLAAVLGESIESVLPAWFALIVPPALVGVIVGYGQVGLKVAPRAVKFDLSRINPVKGLERMFSVRSVVRISLAAAKILVIVAAISMVAWTQIGDVSSLSGGDVGPALAGVGNVLVRCTVAGVLALLAIALLDFLFQRSQHEKDLRMSKKEVKEELKNTDGDPHVKARIRQIQREMSARRMMDDVPKATVVVTNPTHFAVALQYERDDGEAPIVVAKGVDHVARRIKELALEAGVMCYEDRVLARALHATVDIGDTIPEELFQAVAGVLAYVYRMQGERVAS